MPQLVNLLKNARNLLFIGVGNVLKQDDGVGVVISRQIIERPVLRSLTVEVSIENYIGKINSMEPNEIVIIDSMELGATPGTWSLLPLENVEDITFNTHNISLGRLIDFFPYPSYILGIQPLSIEFGDRLSLPVQDAVTQILRIINQQNN